MEVLKTTMFRAVIASTLTVIFYLATLQLARWVTDPGLFEVLTGAIANYRLVGIACYYATFACAVWAAAEWVALGLRGVRRLVAYARTWEVT